LTIFNCPMPFTFSCFTTEILEGFDVLRTSGYADTVKTYSNLTSSIIEYYNTNFSSLAEISRACPTYDEFERNCHGLKRKTVSQIFALQLMQVSFATGPSHGSFDAMPHLNGKVILTCCASNAGASSNGTGCTGCRRAVSNSFVACTGVLHAC
jgi:hypothetical protein